MATTPNASFRLSRRSVLQLEKLAKSTAKTKTQVLEMLIGQAAQGEVAATGEDALWLAEEAERRGLSCAEVLADTLRAARTFPAAYYAHVNAVQSWTAARLMTALYNRMFGDDAREILDACAEGAAEAFGSEPERPAAPQKATPKTLRRVFTNIPELP